MSAESADTSLAGQSERDTLRPLPVSLVVGGVLLLCLGGLWLLLLLPVLAAGDAGAVVYVLLAALIAPGIGLLLRRYWARPLGIVSACVFVVVPILALSCGGIVHWLHYTVIVLQLLAAITAVALLIVEGGNEALVGGRRAAHWAAGIVIAIILVLVALTFAVDDEGSSPFRMPEHPHADS